jgi:DNA anti-recombination protein RmuC
MAVFSDAFLRLRQDLDRSHESRQKLLQDIRANVRDMARQTNDQLTEQGQNRRAEFKVMITDLRGTIKQQAEQTHEQLAALTADLHQGGAAFGNRQPARQPARQSARQPARQSARKPARQPARKHATRSR